jgi:hypothetical protein
VKPNERFLSQNKRFWACVRAISEIIGYSARGRSSVLIPQLSEIEKAFRKAGFVAKAEGGNDSDISRTVQTVAEYFEYRAQTLNGYVEPRLMQVERARDVFKELKSRLSPACPIPMNKQTGDKKVPAYFTGIVNMLIEAHSEGLPCDYDPRSLTTFTRDGWPVRTFARRVDGAFPAVVNPIAIWEIKEYYYTTTFGSRVADGIYETLLDGMEIAELRRNEGIRVLHYLLIDSHYTWWECGRSYLCRILDMLHMGYIDEALFGWEVIERLPDIVRQWVRIARQENARAGSGFS